jgi:hypothetical protein
MSVVRMRDELVQVIRLVDDLPEARRHFEALGFAVVAGGRHPGRGTANLIIALGRQYVELLAVLDEQEARRSPQGRPVLDAWHQRGPGLARWSVQPADIDATADRLGLPVERRQRTRPDGMVVSWRAVAVDLAWAEPWRCAFMAWDDPSSHPALRTIAHANGASGFQTLEVDVPDPAGALEWLGGSIPPSVSIRRHPKPGKLRAYVATQAGPIQV